MTVEGYQQFLALAGIAVALYALYVEHSVAAAFASGLEYKAACDFGSWASCSKVLGSSYGHILSHWGIVAKGSALDLPNALLGSGFYVLALLAPLLRIPKPVLLSVSVLSLAFSLYLAYILRFVLHDFCIVCVASYVINIALFFTFVFGGRKAKKDAVASAKKK